MTKMREADTSLVLCLQGEAQLDQDDQGGGHDALVLEAIADLDPPHRRLLELDMVERATPRQIERRMGLPEGSFPSRKREAMAALRDRLLKQLK
jgi:DNA-directed RNA polymerase specialized sigma24 family protein